MTIVVPLRVESVSNKREHWAARAKRTRLERNAVALVWRIHGPRVSLPCAVTLTRVAPRALDGDNLQAAFKAVRDQLAHELGLPNDADPRVAWGYGQRRGEPKQYEIEIAIEPKGEGNG
jgi:hypothetical protein